MEKLNKRVIIIGGGPGGLSAAIRLAKSGYDIKLFEQNDHLGGKMNFVQEQGYYFDTGPSLLTMVFVIDELFQFAGFNRLDYLKYKPIDPVCRYFWNDGTRLDTSTDQKKMVQQLGKLSSEDGENYNKFLEYSKRIYDLTADIFLFNPVHEWKKALNWKNLKTVFRIFQIDPMRTMHRGVSRFFSEKKIIQLFDRYATYNGSNPYQAPATLNIIPYVEYGLGSFYILGGMYQLVTSLEKIAQKFGIEVNLNTRVEKIVTREKQVLGVIADGKMIKSDYVISNADVVTCFDEMIDGFEKTKHKPKKLEPSLSGMVFLWGINKQHPQLAHHNVIFPENYQQEFTNIFDLKQPPDEPTIYIAITSKTDRDHAPGGSENWLVLLNMPYLNDGQNWDSITLQMRQYVLCKLKQLNIDISDAIEFEKVMTPQDIYNYYGSNRGSIYGISSNNKTTAFRRPPNRSRNVKGLYFVGGSTHPGGGVPLVILSGKMCADLITEHDNN